MADVVITEFKGHKVIVLPMDETGNMKFTFGKKKAQTIVKYFDEIKKFAEDNDESES